MKEERGTVVRGVWVKEERFLEEVEEGRPEERGGKRTGEEGSGGSGGRGGRLRLPAKTGGLGGETRASENERFAISIFVYVLFTQRWKKYFD